MPPTRPAAQQIGFASLTIGMMMTSTSEIAVPPAPRPATWAEAVELEGVPNLHRVTPRFYRSAQPTEEGFANLSQDLGVKSIVSLRAFHADDVLAGGNHLMLTRIPIHTWNIEDQDVVRALRTVLHAQEHGPVLLHCQHGSDRTGLISALYRIIVEGWSRDDALAEMRGGEFGYHAVWGNIPRYLKTADIPALKAAVHASRPE
ncbi:dual specificity protein phosphatase family protein [Labrys okinawensis]|uniref:dual specificity protein phosphatase family protein n=1 Tax=Labrys okinawensis TaxID=346911 RepID=UPI0039BC890B